MKFFRSSKKQQSSAQNAAEIKPKQGLFARLGKSRDHLTRGLLAVFSSGIKLDDALYDEIEDQLVMADIGVSASQQIVLSLRQAAKQQNLKDGSELLSTLRSVVSELLSKNQNELPDYQTAVKRPFVILMVGVNGVGKTTTCAKLAAQAKQQGYQVMMAACDTFRAAAIEQLQSWGNKLEIPVIAQSHGADAAAVAFDAYSAAKARGADLLLIDSAGRQHTQNDHMEQLKKIKRVLGKTDDAVPDEVWITVDAGNGQNVMSQVTHFHDAVDLSGLCVTKLDGTAKGGIVLSLAERFELPIRYIGVGESVEDLREFDVDSFVEALMPVLDVASSDIV